MWFRSMFKPLTRSFRGRQQSAADRKRHARRLLLEGLEDRSLLSSFAFTDVGTLGGPTSNANDVNTSGQVVGFAADANSLEHAFIWTNGVMTDLGTLGGQGGWGRSSAQAINDRGQVVGLATTASNVWHAFLVTPEDTDADGSPDRWYRDTNADGGNDLMRDLGTLGGTQSSASDINEWGQVVGWSHNSAGASRAFLWQNGAMTDLGTLDGLQTNASAINDAGQIVGGSQNSVGDYSAFLWQNGTMTDLGVFSASDINNAGHVVGENYYGLGFLWTPTTPNGAVGTFADLPPLTDSFPDEDSRSFAAGINNAGQVVGTSRFEQNGEEGSYYMLDRAVIWPDDVPRDLSQETFGTYYSWKLTYAAAINDAGQIVGQTDDGHAYLLTPISTDVPQLTIGDVTVQEGNSGTTEANFAVTLSAASDQPVTVAYATADGTATASSDYAATSGTLTFAPGEISKIIALQFIGDRIGESTEYFSVNLSDPLNAFIADANGLGTILDDEPIVSVDGYFSDVEGNTGTKAFTFTVSLSSQYDMPVTVDYSTADLTPDEQDWYGPGAIAGVDYTARSGTVTFAAHQTTSETITVLVNGDGIGESDELFFVHLSNPNGASLGAAQAQGIIVNDEPSVWIDSAASIPEGNSGQTAMNFTLHLSAPYDVPVSVDYTTVDSSAIAGSDYGAVVGTATIAANTTSQTITVLVNGDTLAEDNEYLAVNVTGVSGAILSGGWAYGTILNDDPPPAIYIGDASIVEGNSGTRTMNFTVSLSHPSGKAVSVNYATANGTAKTSDNDYTAASGRLDFAPGDTTKTITVTIRGDIRKEANEYFLVKLSGAVGATIANGQGQGTIANDDGGGKLSGKGNRSHFFASAVDAAFDHWMASAGKKRGR